jgi:hypothetical protein
VSGCRGVGAQDRGLLGTACRRFSLACCLLVLACCVLALPPLACEAEASGEASGRPAAEAPGRPAAEEAGATAPHDLHLAYGDLAIEGSLIAGRIRMFKDDLEQALAPLVGVEDLTLEPGSEADALVMRYVRDNLHIRVDGQELEAALLGRGEDDLDLEPVWWVIVQYEAPSPVTELHVRNTLLFDVYDDQRNVFKFVHFPDEKQRTFYFAEGESEHVVRF